MIVVASLTHQPHNPRTEIPMDRTLELRSLNQRVRFARTELFCDTPVPLERQ